MRTFSIYGLAAAVALFVGANPAAAKITGLERVASGLSSPIYATHAPGDTSRLFIVQRGGSIRILDLDSGTLEATPFLSIPGVITSGEGGLLGMAFHPDYATNGKFYVNVTLSNGGQMFQGATSPFSTHIREYTVSSDPNVANPTPKDILTFIQPQSNHNAGWIGFSPNDGYLYIPTGDGGGGNDRDFDGDDQGHTPDIGNAQDITDNLLGKILRIDVNVPADDNPDDDPTYLIPEDNPYVGVEGDDEIWARGLRNPFRDSFDRLTGDLWLGDVGQGFREEINMQPVDAEPGENFGWRVHEGSVENSSLEKYRNPVYAYDRDNDQFGGSVVTGGYVYRGSDPSLQGKYFFLDSRSSPDTADDNYWMLDSEAADPASTVANIDALLTPDVGTPQFPVSFAEDELGNLYIVYLFGSVYRIATDGLYEGDYNLDGTVDAVDYTVWRNNLDTNFEDADGNRNGMVDAGDYTVWKNNYGNAVELGAGGLSNVPEPCVGLFIGQLLMLGLLAWRSRAKME